ncbi:MAG: flagellar basal body P-ring formation chaperone FlgA [Alphaproteobacteria bacterium]
MRTRTLLFTAACLVCSGLAQAATMSIPVPTRTVAAGEKLDDAAFTLKDTDSTKVYASTVQGLDELTGMQASHPLRAGAPISRLHVKTATDVTRNSTVTVVYRKPGLELVGNGQALEDGRVGESIKVLNPESRATLVGVVVSANQVEVH